MAKSRPVYIPTPEELAERAKEVRAGWTEDEELRRRVVKPSPARVFRLSLGRSARGTHVETKD
jgi:hypothetical protein